MAGWQRFHPGIVGVLYNEGDFDSAGNGEYFGSLVLGENTNPKGTSNIWFDERLVKGGWPPPGVTFPRVMVTSEEIQWWKRSAKVAAAARLIGSPFNRRGVEARYRCQSRFARAARGSPACA